MKLKEKEEDGANINVVITRSNEKQPVEIVALSSEHREYENKRVKGIDRSFELRCEIRLNRFVMTNWRLGNFFYFILKGQHHKISKKPLDAA
jgi:hypothetical protein